MLSAVPWWRPEAGSAASTCTYLNDGMTLRAGTRGRERATSAVLAPLSQVRDIPMSRKAPQAARTDVESNLLALLSCGS
eukprot:753905-Lingulodinium_polyedra.AAC.1